MFGITVSQPLRQAFLHLPVEVLGNSNREPGFIDSRLEHKEGSAALVRGLVQVARVGRVVQQQHGAQGSRVVLQLPRVVRVVHREAG